MKYSISDLLTAPWKTGVVFTAVRLKIFTILSEKMMTVEELASNCSAKPQLLKPLLDACVTIGLLDAQYEQYVNSHLSRIYLVEGQARYVGDLIQLQYIESKQWDKLYNIILEDEAEVRSDENEHKTFIKAMDNLGMSGEAEAIRDSIDLSGCRVLVDAGGGSGLYSIILCRKYPELRSIILDKSETLAVTREIIAKYPEKESITLREADITKESFGNNVDAVLLSDVIYTESEAVPILRNAWNCLRENGILIVRGYYSDPEGSRPLFGALFVLNLLVFDPEREIMTISALQKNISATGFTITKTANLTERSYVIIAQK